jgi:hypothetical protein
LQMTLWYGLICVMLLPLLSGYRPRYSMPAYAAITVALAILGDGIAAGGWAGRIWRGIVLALGALAIPLGLVSMYLNHFQVGWILAGLAAAGLGIWVLKSRGQMTSVMGRWQLSAVAAAALALAVWGIALLKLEKHAPLRENSAKVLAQLNAGENFIAYRPGHVPFLVYLHDRFDFVVEASKLPAGSIKVFVEKEDLGELTATGRDIQTLTEFKYDKRTFLIVQVGSAKTP